MDDLTHRFWLSEAAKGNPPDPVQVFEHQYNLHCPWHVRRFILKHIKNLGRTNTKHRICREMSRGSGKSVTMNALALYAAEYIIPFLQRARQENKRINFIGRTVSHIEQENMKSIHGMICEFAPWLKTLDNREWEDRGSLFETQIRGGRTWTLHQMDLTNGVSIRGFGFDQSVRGSHVYLTILEDVVEERTMMFGKQQLEVLQGAIEPSVEPGGLIVVDGCLTGDTDVLMSDGTSKKITDVGVGELVWTTDKYGKGGERKVLAKIPQGTRPVFKITTSGGSVIATGNHPFLTVVDGRLEWVEAESLKKNDLVVSARQIPNLKNEYDWLNESIAWFFGFFLGDGWLATNGYQIAIAISKNDEANEKLYSIWREVLPFVPFQTVPFGGKAGGGYIKASSKQTHKMFKSLGLAGKAKTKRIPQWLFRCSSEIKRAFLRGLCEADGKWAKRSTDTSVLELANPEMIRDVFNLAITCGIKPGTIRSRTRYVRSPSTGEIILSETSSVGLNFEFAKRQEYSNTSRGGTKHQRDAVLATKIIGENFRLVRVVSVEAVGEDRVYDLTVDAARSFVANGHVVHNTPLAESDLYNLLSEMPDKWDYAQLPAHDLDGKLGYRKFNLEDISLGVLDKTCIKQDADLDCLWPYRLNFEYLMAERGQSRASEIKFRREYMLERIVDSTSLVHPNDIAMAKDQHSTYYKSIKNVTTYGGIDPSTMQRDAAGIVILTVDPDGRRRVVHLEAIKEGGPLGLIERINSIHDRYRPQWAVEANGFQSSIKPLMEKLIPGMRIESVHITSNKHTRGGWPTIRTIFESGNIVLPYGLTEQERELVNNKKMTEIEADAIIKTNELEHQLKGIQYIDGKIVEDPKRPNDLVSALFMALKAAEDSKEGPSLKSLLIGEKEKIAAKKKNNPELNKNYMPDSGPMGRVNRAIKYMKRPRGL